MTTRLREAGEFCWINILSPETPAAREFFNTLLGWEFTPVPPMGHIITVGGRDIGGLWENLRPGSPDRLPPVIGVMVKVASADDVVAKVRALGGTADDAFDIGPRGRMAICHDPNGANIDIWEAKANPGTDVDSKLHGAPCWFETMTTDVARATKFYGDLFGWTATVKDMGGFQYTTFSLRGTELAGMMQLFPDMAGVPPHWGTYFTVTDADASAKEAVALGGAICVPPQDIPNVGRFCGITSPQGVRFYILQDKR